MAAEVGFLAMLISRLFEKKRMKNDLKPAFSNMEQCSYRAKLPGGRTA